MTDMKEEAFRDALIASRSATLAEIAEQLLKEDAGAALVKAALTCWERQYGKDGAIELATTAMAAIMLDINRTDPVKPN